MKIDSLGDLKRLIVLCQKQGVRKIKVDGVELEIDEAPPAPREAKKSESQEEEDQIESDELSGDALLYYSVTEQAQ